MSTDQGQPSTSSWAVPTGASASSPVPPKTPGPPRRRTILTYILIALLPVALIVAGVIFAPRISAALDPTPTTTITRTCSSQGDSVGTVPDSLSPPPFGPPLVLSKDRSGSYIAVEDARWNSIALAYVKDDQYSAGGTINAIDLTAKKVLWTWDLDQAVGDDGAPFPDATLVDFSGNINVDITPAYPPILFSGSDHVFFCPNGEGRVAVFINGPQSPDSWGPTAIAAMVYVFDVTTGAVVSHTSTGFDMITTPVYVDDTIVLAMSWGQGHVGAISDEGGVLWTADIIATEDVASCFRITNSDTHQALVVNNTWFLTPNGYLDIHTGKPAPFGRDRQTLCYFGIDDLLLREDPWGTFTPWNPKTNKAVGDITYTGEPLIGGDGSYLFLRDQVQSQVSAYSRDTGDFKWRAVGAPLDTNSVTRVGLYYLALVRTGSVAKGWIGVIDSSGKTDVPSFCATSNAQCESLTGGHTLLSLGSDRVLRAYDMNTDSPEIPIWTTTINPDSTLTVVAGHFIAVSTDGIISIGR